MNNIRRLRCFLAAAQDENFGKAAERLGIVSSAFSRNIAELEVDLGVRLFDRVGRGVRLSAVGTRYAEQVADILRRLDQANDEMRQLVKKEAQQIKIGLLDFTGLQEKMIEVLRVLRRALPTSEIMLSPLGSIEQIRRIEVGSLDAGFIYNWPESSSMLDSFSVLMDRWLVAIPEDHRLASARQILLADMAGEPFVSIAPEASPSNINKLMRECAAQQFRPNIVQFAANTNGIMALVAAGVGICFATELTQSPPGVVLRQIEDLNIPVPLDFVWRRGEGRPEIAAIIDTIVTALQETIPARQRDAPQLLS